MSISVVAGVVGLVVVVAVVVAVVVGGVGVGVPVDAWPGGSIVTGLAFPLRRWISGLGLVGLGLRLGLGVCKAVELWDSDGIGRRGHVVGPVAMRWGAVQ